MVEDCGSRAGVRVGGARLPPGVAIPLRGEGEIALGPTSALSFRPAGDGLIVEVTRGLDRGARVLVGAAPVPLGPALPAADGLAVQVLHDVLRLERPPSSPCASTVTSSGRRATCFTGTSSRSPRAAPGSRSHEREREKRQ